MSHDGASYEAVMDILVPYRPPHPGTTHSSNSKVNAPLEVAKGHHVGYVKAIINLGWFKL